MKPTKYVWILAVYTVIYSQQLFAEPPQTGNFALPASQQPGPLISIGQNILDKGTLQVFSGADHAYGRSQSNTTMSPSLLYGITDDFSFLFNVPITLKAKSDSLKFSGIGDIYPQFEYGFYSAETATYADQATVLVNMTLPTGSTKKNPSTGLGSPSFLIGATFARSYTDWFGFVSPATVQTTSHHHMKPGNQYLYQGGLGRNLYTIDNEWIFAWLVEADGTWSNKNKAYGASDPDSGGNVLLITPSLWISSKRLIFQAGVSIPAIQKLKGQQTKNKYILVANIGFTF